MKTKIFKLLIPAPIGAGSICLTMKLTNQANTSLLGLGELRLESIPELPEKEIRPTVPPIKQKQPPSSPPTSGGGGDNEGDQDQKQDTSKDQSPSSSSGGVAAENVIELLKKQIMNITTNSNQWLEHSKELSSVHSVVSSISTLVSSLEIFKQQTTQSATKPAAAPDGGGGQSSVQGTEQSGQGGSQ